MMAGRPNFDFLYLIIDNSNPIHNEELIANVFVEFYHTIFNQPTTIQDTERKK